MKLRLLTTALEDLNDGREFYDRQSPGIGIYFLETLFSDIESLKLHAGHHRKIQGFHKLLSRRFPYAVYYEVERDVVLIWRVLDSRRNPSWTAQQLKRTRTRDTDF